MNDNSLQQAQGQTGFLSSDVEELIKSQDLSKFIL